MSWITACDRADSPTPCACCGAEECVMAFPGFVSTCCNGAQCQDTTGVGMVRGGACIPPSCTGVGAVQRLTCVDGTCCGQAGQLCGVVDCCPGSGATCSFAAGSMPICCRPAGAACAVFNECCSFSCTGGVCD